MPITLENWWPCGPLIGPPLPKWLGVTWPWYKVAVAAPPAPVIIIPPEEIPPPEVVTPPVIIPPTKVYAIEVADEQGTGIWGGAYEDPIIRDFIAAAPGYNGGGKYALGAPDGIPAIVIGGAGNYLVLSFGAPISVKTLRLYMVSLYGYPTSNLYRVDVSQDRVNWIKVADASTIGDLPPGSMVYDVPVGAVLQFVRFYQVQSGVSIGVDAIEAIK